MEEYLAVFDRSVLLSGLLFEIEMQIGFLL